MTLKLNPLPVLLGDAGLGIVLLTLAAIQPPEMIWNVSLRELLVILLAGVLVVSLAARYWSRRSRVE